ncbi:cytochrome-c oxidase [Psychrobacillus sp. OK032]|uniref:cytochrome-c oxidase n=1 Tax=Psychrobacillus sp. OK032 TaxID=1884358 RepID=UPI0008D6A904|nr:cytochrome-c oxidase [Psychrobacillus sp. OK032]SES10817.1 Cytochrome C and Quinol oxidase polypeptide I [Psychrobacillus sp. OK032]
MGIRFIKISVVYFVIGVLLGLYMSMAHDYALTGVHVHVNLLGWASFALAGFIYHLFPSTSSNMYAKLHFWSANIGLPLMMIALTVLILNGAEVATVFIAIGGVLVVFSVIMFAINVLANVRAAN